MSSRVSLKSFIVNIPKSELHVHIEGAFEPELMFEIASRNDLQTKFEFESVEQLRTAYNFRNLQEFLDLYYKGVGVLIEEQDFYDLTLSYLTKARSQNVLHAEMFFDPQAHTSRGIAFRTVVTGIHRAQVDARQKLEISTRLIMCFLRNLDPTSAMETFEEALPYKSWIKAIGLDSYEVDNPPSKFEEVFKRAREEGFLSVAHAGEEGPSEYIWEAIDLLKVLRIDHGFRSLDDEKLIHELVRREIPLTMCPLSNLKLGVAKSMEEHPLKTMMEKGVLVTINSDDPAYFGGYINENYIAAQKALGLSKEEIYILARNSFEASFLEIAEKEKMIELLEEYCLRRSLR